jgi:hypothetical protein
VSAIKFILLTLCSCDGTAIAVSYMFRESCKVSGKQTILGDAVRSACGPDTRGAGLAIGIIVRVKQV